MTTTPETLSGFINPSRDTIPDWLRKKIDETEPQIADAFACGFVGQDHGEVALLFVLEDETIALVSMDHDAAIELGTAVIAILSGD